MKIEEIKQKNKITPVTITLENEGELELMRALAGLIYYSDNTARITKGLRRMKSRFLLIKSYKITRKLSYETINKK